jgi:trigger factor
MMFEMDLEVRPDFPLPAYKALSVKRPVKTIEDADVDAQLKLFLERHAQMVPKLEGGAEIGDYVTADLRFHRDGETLNEAKEVQFRLQPELRFQDGSVPKVGDALVGVKPGESRDAEAHIGSGSTDPNLRGQTIQVTFQVHDLKQLRLPEVNNNFLSGIGFDSEDELRGALREILERRLKAQQRQSVRREILEQLIAETPFELPADLVNRQEKATLRRLILDMRQEGLNETEIRAREAEIRANAHESTLRGLKEFFILAKIAETEDIKVEDEDFEMEIDAIAARTDESPRRVRARIEKDGLGDALASQILERKALDRILDYVTYEEVPHVEQQAVETLDQSASSLVASDNDEADASAGGDASTAGSKDES